MSQPERGRPPCLLHLLPISLLYQSATGQAYWGSMCAAGSQESDRMSSKSGSTRLFVGSPPQKERTGGQDGNRGTVRSNVSPAVLSGRMDDRRSNCGCRGQRGVASNCRCWLNALSLIHFISLLMFGVCIETPPRK